MPRDWKRGYCRELRRKATERGKHGAKVRWQRERERQRRLAALDPVRVGGRIVKRVIVIDNETDVRERTFYAFDLASDWTRKMREVLA